MARVGNILPLLKRGLESILSGCLSPVSYTHLDVYKGQESILSDGADSESRTAAASTR
ncbi:hypothetical protein [Erwinia amylovora]